MWNDMLKNLRGSYVIIVGGVISIIIAGSLFAFLGDDKSAPTMVPSSEPMVGAEGSATPFSYDQNGEAKYAFTNGGTFFNIKISNRDGPFAPDQETLERSATEWIRRVNDGYPWSEYSVNNQLGVFDVNISTIPADPSDEIVLVGANHWLEAIQSTDTNPVTPPGASEVKHRTLTEAELAPLSSRQIFALEVVGVLAPELQFSIYAIGCAESGWRDDAVGPLNPNRTYDSGDEQLNSPWFDGTAYPGRIGAFPAAWKAHPAGNIIGALIIHKISADYEPDGDGFDAWSTWIDGGRTAEGTLALAHSQGNCVVQD